MHEIAPGLWRWTAPHPDWEPGPVPGSPSDRERDIGSVLHDGAGALARALEHEPA